MSGYKDPPKDKQFKPGQSGNPRGRPRGSRNKTKEFLALIAEIGKERSKMPRPVRS
jgi:hypothetical protein